MRISISGCASEELKTLTAPERITQSLRQQSSHHSRFLFLSKRDRRDQHVKSRSVWSSSEEQLALGWTRSCANTHVHTCTEACTCMHTCTHRRQNYSLHLVIILWKSAPLFPFHAEIYHFTSFLTAAQERQLHSFPIL